MKAKNIQEKSSVGVLTSLLFFMEEHENKKVGNDNIESGKQVKNPFRKGVV